MERVLFVIVFIILIIIFINIRVVLIKDINSSLKLNLYILSIIKININIDKILKKYKTGRLLEIIKKLINDIDISSDSIKFIFSILKILKINNIYIKVYYSFLKYPNIYIYYTIWMGLSIIKNFLDKKTLKVVKEKYMVVVTENINNIDIYLDISISIVRLIYVGVKNIKYILRRMRKYGTSN